MKKNILFFVACFLMLSSCEDLIDPAVQNFKDEGQMYNEPNFAMSYIIYAYRNLPGYYADNDYATDDAVTNDRSNSSMRAATGAWTAENNPFSFWNNGFASIQYVNYFLEHVDKVNFVVQEEPNRLQRVRTKGEAYGLRALHLYNLLRAHAGYTSDGVLMGVPILTKYQDAQADFNQPRATFEDCINRIYADLDSAEQFLPMEYNKITDVSEIPKQFLSVTQNVDFYNRIMGKDARQLYNSLIAKAVRSRVSLLAASAAFQSPSDQTKWALAADNAAKVIDYAGGVSGLASKGNTYYANADEITNNTTEGTNPPEIIWRESLLTTNSDMEKSHYPPSLFGNGRMNPTQNLVDAFPMANGYPISDVTNSGYNPSDPYTGRDPRLALYIIYNGSREGVNNAQIFTGSQSGTDDGLNKRETSTRTGYYMKKRLRTDVNCNPASTQGQSHYIPRIRYTEIFLNYAEAANEAWGPKGAGNHAYSSYDVIKAIRKRAGVGTTNGDPYLEECAADVSKMRQLIRNERRLELCFEGFRFWDLRRWKLSLNNIANGMNVNQNTYTPVDVEIRAYQDYMYYGPIPYSEVLKYSNLVQNKGWSK
jgi:hypothetical protein